MIFQHLHNNHLRTFQNCRLYCLFRSHIVNSMTVSYFDFAHWACFHFRKKKVLTTPAMWLREYSNPNNRLLINNGAMWFNTFLDRCHLSGGWVKSSWGVSQTFDSAQKDMMTSSYAGVEIERVNWIFFSLRRNFNGISWKTQ